MENVNVLTVAPPKTEEIETNLVPAGGDPELFPVYVNTAVETESVVAPAEKRIDPAMITSTLDTFDKQITLMEGAQTDAISHWPYSLSRLIRAEADNVGRINPTDDRLLLAERFARYCGSEHINTKTRAVTVHGDNVKVSVEGLNDEVHDVYALLATAYDRKARNNYFTASRRAEFFRKARDYRERALSPQTYAIGRIYCGLGETAISPA